MGAFLLAVAMVMPAQEAAAVSDCTNNDFVLDDDGTSCSISMDATGGTNKLVTDITSITLQETVAGANGTLTLGSAGGDTTLTTALTVAASADGDFDVSVSNTVTSGGAIGTAGSGDLLSLTVLDGATFNLGHDLAALTTTVGAGASGVLNLSAGTLTATTLLVASGATLAQSGTGDITAATTIQDGGTMTVGSSFTHTGALTVGGGTSGTFTLGGNTVTVGGANAFTMDAGATLNITITSSTSAGQVVATGAAPSIDAGTTLDITVSSSDYIPTGTVFTIVDVGAAGINVPGTVTDNSSVLSFAASVLNNDLIITTNRLVIYVSTAGSSVGAGAAAVLETISDAGATGDIATVLNALDGLSDTTLTTAIITTTPEVGGGVTAASFIAQEQTLGTVSARLGDLRDELDEDAMIGFATGNHAKGIGIWLRGFGNRSDQDKRKGVDGYEADTYGIAVGGDKRLLDDRLTLGLAYAYAGSNINSTGDRDGNGTDLASHQGTVYIGYDAGRWYAEGMVNLGYNDYDSVRRVSVGSIVRTAKGDYQGWQIGAKAGGGYNLNVGKAVVTVMASLQYSHLELDGYTETGADSLNLTVGDLDFDQLRSSLGARVAYQVETDAGTLVPEIHAAWLFDIVADKQEITSTYSGGGGSFKTEGASPARHGANLGASVALRTTSNTTFSANYDAEFRDEYISHSGMLTARYAF